MLVRLMSLLGAVGAMIITLGSAPSAAQAAGPSTLTIFAAGTLAVPFRQLDAEFERQHPGTSVEALFGGSVMMAKRITNLHQPADLIAVADYNVIPKYLFGDRAATAYASWYAGFARNAITFIYTDKSKYAAEITPQNWYQILARPGVAIGRSDPDTDPSGYQTVQMLDLAEKYYKMPGLAAKILANAPKANMRDTETALISALQLGQIDYLAIYRSDALQHQFRYLDLPAQIDLSDPRDAGSYSRAIAHTKNGDLLGRPIVYAITIPSDAARRDLAEAYLTLLLGPQGQAVFKANGFGSIVPAYAVHPEAMPETLRPLVTAWPSS